MLTTPYQRICLAILIFHSMALMPLAAAEDNSKPTDNTRPEGQLWGLTLYQGMLTDATLIDMATLNADYESDYRFVALALARRLSPSNSYWILELEGQLAKHTKGQDHQEINALLALRWHRFPWNSVMDTSAAAGVGLSYATQVPEFELLTNQDKSKKLLAYLLFELTLGLPSIPRWAVVGRVHHRSGAYGLFGEGIRGASNALALGLRYRF